MFGDRYFGRRYFGNRYWATSNEAADAPVTIAGRSFGTQYRERTISRELRDKERAARRSQRQAEQEAREAENALPLEILAQLDVMNWLPQPPAPIDPQMIATLDAFARVGESEDDDFLLLANN